MLYPHPRSTRGSALITVVIFTTVLVLICGSILGWAYTERKLNYRNSLRLEARNAAEAAAEYGLTQIRQKLEARNTYTTNAFAVGSDAPLVPPAAFFSGSKVDYLTVELAAGIIQTVPAGGGSYYVNPDDISNQSDPLKGKYVTRRDISIMAKATVNPPANQGAPVTAYVGQRLSFRGAPLFAHAIFYNMDLEIAPGPNMTVWGPVHANGNIYVSKQGAGGLNFMAPVTATGGLYKGFKSVGGVSVAPITNSGTRETTANNDIFFTNGAGALVNLMQSGTWRDQLMGASAETNDTNSSFRSYSSNTYNGNLQTKSHGIQTYNPVAIGNYVEDPTPSNGVDNSVNQARAMIEPPIPSTDSSYNAELEDQKFSRKSGLYIAVNPSTSSRTARKPDGTAYTLAAGEVKAFKSDGTEVRLPGSASHSTPGGDPIVTIKPDQMTDLRRHSESYANTTARSGSNAYTGKVIDIIEVDMNALKKSVERSVNGSANATIYPNYTSSSATPVAVTAANAIEGFNSSDWNGSIYIESVDAETRQDSGVRLINGRGAVASKSGAAGVANEGLTIATNDAMYVLGHFNADGTLNTVANSATNSARHPEPGERPVALVADAVTLLSQPTFNNTGVQTGGWNDALSGLRYDIANWNPNWSTTAPSNANRIDGSNTATLPSTYPGASPSTASPDVKFTAGTTEIAAAFLVGLTPSNKNGYRQNSGGVHNLPRFLENWTGNTAAIRGSIVVMFESRVADEPFNLRVYAPPIRLWGFNSLFGTQNRYPPQTPYVRSYRRVDFTDITNRKGDYSSAAAEFAALKALFPTGAGTTGATRTAFDEAAEEP